MTKREHSPFNEPIFESDKAVMLYSRVNTAMIGKPPEVFVLKHESARVAYSDHSFYPECGSESAKPVLHGPNNRF